MELPPHTQPRDPSIAKHVAQIDAAVQSIRLRLPEEYASPRVGILCGSGHASLALLLKDPCVIPYDEIPHMPRGTVAGHQNRLVVGTIDNIVTACFLGRLHYYEGHSLRDAVFPVHVLAKLGTQSLLITNAAGAIDDSLRIGDIVVISDHISFLALAGISPLRGENIVSLGPRFPAMTEAYHRDSFGLVSQAAILAEIAKDAIRQGIYVGLGGPSYETRAELRFLRMIGGSVVGMSTVSEVVAAAHAGLNVLALSLVTNLGISHEDHMLRGDIPAPTHEEVLLATKLRELDMQRLVLHLVPLMYTHMHAENKK